jgi:hypothetical protein
LCQRCEESCDDLDLREATAREWFVDYRHAGSTLAGHRDGDTVDGQLADQRVDHLGLAQPQVRLRL